MSLGELNMIASYIKAARIAKVDVARMKADHKDALHDEYMGIEIDGVVKSTYRESLWETEMFIYLLLETRYTDLLKFEQFSISAMDKIQFKKQSLLDIVFRGVKYYDSYAYTSTDIPIMVLNHMIDNSRDLDTKFVIDSKEFKMVTSKNEKYHCIKTEVVSFLVSLINTKSLANPNPVPTVNLASDSRSELEEDALQTNIKIIKKVVKRVPKLTAPSKDTVSPLMCACAINNFKLVKVLVRAGAGVNETVNNRQIKEQNGVYDPKYFKFKSSVETPLSYAVRYSDLEIIKYLVKKGADITSQILYLVKLGLTYGVNIKTLEYLFSFPISKGTAIALQSYSKYVNNAKTFEGERKYSDKTVTLIKYLLKNPKNSIKYTSQLETMVEYLEAELDTAVDTNVHLIGELTECKETIGSLEEEVRSLCELNNRLEGDVFSLEGSIGALEQELEVAWKTESDLRNKVNKKDEMISALNVEIVDLQNEVYDEDYENVNDSDDSDDSDNSDKSECETDYDSQIERLRVLLEEQDNTIKKLQSQVNEDRDMILLLQQDNYELRQELVECTD